MDIIRGDAETLVRFRERLAEVEQEFVAPNDDGAGGRYVLAVGLFPTDPNVAVPEDVKAFLDISKLGPEARLE